MIKIGNREIGAGHAPFVIAEMSGNHNQSLERAQAIVDAVAKTGAHALKIQTYTPDIIQFDHFRIEITPRAERDRERVEQYAVKLETQSRRILALSDAVLSLKNT